MGSKLGAKFYNVTRREMEACLGPLKFTLLNDPADDNKTTWSPDLRHSIDGQPVTELVYGCRVQPLSLRMTVRVYSGIWLTGASRDVGEDAIRVILAWIDTEPYETFETDQVVPRVVGVEKRVHRIPTWADNLRKRIFNWREGIGPDCPSCNAPMVLRHKANDASSKFWGCARYNHDDPAKGCRKTLNVNKER